MKKFVIGILSYLSFITYSFADHNTHLFEQANNFYEQGKYEEAIMNYESIIQGGYESWEVYYNLGNAYYKNKQLGKAILNYERAKSLESKNEDILYNLELANLMVVDKISTPPDFFLFKIFRNLKNYFALNTLTLIVILLYVLLAGFIILRILVKNRIVYKFSSFMIVPLLIMLILFSTVFGFRIYDQKTLKFGIILSEKVNVMSSPEENGTEVFSLHEGVKVQVQNEIGDWRLIRLIDGKVGWIKKDILEII